MKPIEIKQRKKIVVPFIVACVLMISVAGYGVLFSEKYRDNNTLKVSFLIGVALFAYSTYSPVKKLLKNQAIIVLSRDSIILNTEKPVLISKNEVEHIEVTDAGEDGYFLIVKTKGENYKTNISWLDKSPDEIRELVKDFDKTR